MQDSGSVPQRWLWPLLLQIPVVVYATERFMRASYSQLVPTVVDDGFYYLSVARNFWTYHWITYDGINACYGFQPLWQIILIPFAAIPLTTGQFFRCVLILGLVLYCLTGCLIYALVRRVAGTAPSLLSLVAWSYNLAIAKDFVANIKENLVLAPLLLLTALVISGGLPAGRRAQITGVLLGLVWLARFNALLFAVLVLLALMPPSFGRRFGFTWRLWGECCGLATAVAGTWYGYALWAYGTIMPFSGAVKISNARFYVVGVLSVDWFSVEHLRMSLSYLAGAYRILWDWWVGPTTWLLLVPMVLLLIPSFASVIRRRARDAGASNALIAISFLAVYTLVSSWVNTFMLTGMSILTDDKSYVYSTWYFVGESFLPILLIGILANALWDRSSRPALHGTLIQIGLVASYLSFLALRLRHGAGEDETSLWWAMGITVLLLILALSTAAEPVRSRFVKLLRAGVIVTYAAGLVQSHRHLRDGLWPDAPPVPYSFAGMQLMTALALRDGLPRDTVIASADSGVFGYFSELPVINMEGLMNSREYFRAYLERRTLRTFFEECNTGLIYGFSFLNPADGRLLHEHLADLPFEYSPVWRPFPDHDSADGQYGMMVLYAPEWSSWNPRLFASFGQVCDHDRWTHAPRFLHADGSVSGDGGGSVLNFETGDIQGWEVTGRAFAVQRGDGEGEWVLGSSDDTQTGSARSMPFSISRTRLCVRMAGQRDPKNLLFRVVCESRVVAEITGPGTDRFIETEVDLSADLGREARLEIIDSSPDGHLTVDDIRFVRVIP